MLPESAKDDKSESRSLTNQEAMTIQELASYFRVSVRHIYRLMKRDKKIPFYEMGTSYRFDLFKVKAALERNPEYVNPQNR